MTVAQLADSYFVAIEKTHRSHRAVRRSIECDALPTIGPHAAEDVRRRDIIAIIDTIAERGAPILANRVRNMISGMWSWAMAAACNACRIAGTPWRAVRDHLALVRGRQGRRAPGLMGADEQHWRDHQRHMLARLGRPENVYSFSRR